MKVIDLLNKISNQEPVPNKILVDGKYFYWDSEEMFYQTENKLDLLELGKQYSTWDYLTFSVMEIEEYKEIGDIDNIEELFVGETTTEEILKINDLIKAVKQLNKMIKEKE